MILEALRWLAQWYFIATGIAFNVLVGLYMLLRWTGQITSNVEVDVPVLKEGDRSRAHWVTPAGKIVYPEELQAEVDKEAE